MVMVVVGRWECEDLQECTSPLLIMSIDAHLPDMHLPFSRGMHSKIVYPGSDPVVTTRLTGATPGLFSRPRQDLPNASLRLLRLGEYPSWRDLMPGCRFHPNSYNANPSQLFNHPHKYNSNRFTNKPHNSAHHPLGRNTENTCSSVAAVCWASITQI